MCEAAKFKNDLNIYNDRARLGGSGGGPPGRDGDEYLGCDSTRMYSKLSLQDGLLCMCVYVCVYRCLSVRIIYKTNLYFIDVCMYRTYVYVVSANMAFFIAQFYKMSLTR